MLGKKHAPPLCLEHYKRCAGLTKAVFTNITNVVATANYCTAAPMDDVIAYNTSAKIEHKLFPAAANMRNPPTRQAILGRCVVMSPETKQHGPVPVEIDRFVADDINSIEVLQTETTASKIQRARSTYTCKLTSNLRIMGAKNEQQAIFSTLLTRLYIETLSGLTTPIPPHKYRYFLMCKSLSSTALP